MTLRTSSATRFSVVSRSSVVFTTSATSSRRGSTSEARPVCEAVIFTSYIIAADWRGASTASFCNWQFVIGNLKIESGGPPQLRITICQLQILNVLQYTDIRKIAVALRIVQAVTNHVGIGNCEADVLRLDRLFAARRLV